MRQSDVDCMFADVDEDARTMTYEAMAIHIWKRADRKERKP